MSTQRSFFTVLSLFLCIYVPIRPHLLDDLNELFVSQVWLLVDEEQSFSPNHSFPGQPVYEKETPQDPNQPQAPLPPEKSLVLKKEDIRFSDIVGQDEAVANLKAVVEQFKNPQRLRMFGGEVKKGILLEGPPGTGKTMLARATANELGFSFHDCAASSFVEVYVGTGAQRVRELFDNAKRTAPSIVFIDEIDAIAAANRHDGDSSGGNMEYRQTLNELLTQMNGITPDSQVLVMTATNTIAAVDEAFKAPHRFEIVTIGLPGPNARKQTLQHYLNCLPRVETSEGLLDYIVEKTGSFSQAQLKSIVNSAVQLAIADQEADKVADVHIKYAVEQARNAMRTGMFGSQHNEYDKVTFQDVAGLDDVVDEFKFLVYGLTYPERLKEFGVSLPKGILLASKPGCGKTLMVRALANEANCQVLYAAGSSLDGKFMGDGAKEIRKIFDQARMISPAIIFFDELDAIQSPQSVNELLTQMDGFKKDTNVVVIGATNVPEQVDYRLRREGRFSKIMSISPPNEAERKAILKLYVDKLPLVNKKTVPYDKLVLHTKGFTGAALKNIVNDAAMQACREQVEEVGAQHFEDALNRALRARKHRR